MHLGRISSGILRGIPGGWIAVVIGLFFVLPAGAVTTAPKPIDPLLVKCILRERQFFTEILFSRNSKGDLVGEMDHFVSTKDHGRRFLSGSIFFDICSDSTQIQGSTGDPRGLVSPFVLKPVNPAELKGRWIYLHTEHSGRQTQVIFRCAYPQE
jgi:hypothetical protein